LAEFHGILEYSSDSSISKLETKPCGSENFASDDFDEDEESEVNDSYNENVPKRESFADFVTSLGHRVSLKGGITNNLKSLVNSFATTPSGYIEYNRGSLTRNFEAGSSSKSNNNNSNNQNDVVKVVMENMPNVCNLYNFLHSNDSGDDSEVYLLFFPLFLSSSAFCDGILEN
jgi:hypothetical protein